MRDYELMFIVDPRLSDDKIVEMTDQYQEMIKAAGGEIRKVESWGKRKLAYQINKLSEGSYVLLYIRCANGRPFEEVEQRLRQNEHVLRHLTVRTDSGRLRYRGEAAESEDGAKVSSRSTKTEVAESEEEE